MPSVSTAVALSRLPRQDGRRIVVTGATAGLGFFATEHFARLGATVVLATRSAERTAATIAAIRSQVPDARLEHVPLDLASLGSVAAAAAAIEAAGPVDVLVNNAGVLGARARSVTADGHELMFGTNHLGHFALTAALLPHLQRSAENGGSPSRIVQLGSIAHRFHRLDFDDLDNTDYRSFRTYCRSKLAVMLTGFELARRLRESGRAARVDAVIAHPGYAVDELSPSRTALADAGRGTTATRFALNAFAQGKHSGALPIVAAAVDPWAANGQYWGPAGWEQLSGVAARVPAKPHAHDRAAARRLWAASEDRTGVAFTV